MRAPDGQILMIGQRSGRHATIPGWFEYIYARASGEGLAQAEDWGRHAGLGIQQSWMYEVLNTLQATLSRSFQMAMASPAPQIGQRRPLTIVRTDAGMAAYIGNDPAGGIEWSNDNGNTTPVLGATWQNGEAKYLPDNGGKRVREQFDHAKVIELDGKLIYDSDFNGHQELPIPGSVIARQVTYQRPNPAGSPAAG